MLVKVGVLPHVIPLQRVMNLWGEPCVIAEIKQLIALQLLGDVPLNEIIGDTQRGGFDALEAGADGG